MEGVVAADVKGLSRETVLEAGAPGGLASDEFFAVLGHELRRPLNAILGWTHLLRQPNLDEKVREQGLTVIERNAREQAQLIADVLDASQILSGKLTLQLHDVDLVECARVAADRARAETTRRHDWQVVPPTGQVVVRGDASRLQQVALSLLRNAVKFTPEGGLITVEVTAAGDTGWVRVRDTGQGMAQDLLPHIFDPRHRLDRPPRRSHPGLGLGLPIARLIVEAHGGSMAAESEGEGRGSCVRFGVPLTSAPGAQ